MPNIPSNLQPRYNICPTTTIDAVVGTEGKRTLEPMRWGLVPNWWNKPLKEMKMATFNARAERRRSTRADLAVAFWGKGAASNLKIVKGSKVRIICNLESGACNPDEIERLRTVAQVKTHPELHAKVYLTDNAAIIGSSNASANGLAMSANDVAGWREANMVVDDPSILPGIRSWFAKMWKDARSIENNDIDRARALWKLRRQLAPSTRNKKSLFGALRADHELFESSKIYCVAWCEPLDKGAKKISKKLSADGTLRNALFYQPVKPFDPGSWLIRCDFDRATPTITGYAYVPDEVVSSPSNVEGEPLLYAAFPKRMINVGLVSYRLSREEKEVLLSKLAKNPRVKAAWKGGDALIALRELIE